MTTKPYRFEELVSSYINRIFLAFISSNEEVINDIINEIKSLKQGDTQTQLSNEQKKDILNCLKDNLAKVTPVRKSQESGKMMQSIDAWKEYLNSVTDRIDQEIKGIEEIEKKALNEKRRSS